jgi:hypothetical protein
MDSSQSNGASAPPAEEQGRRTEQAAAGGNLVEGDPSVSSRTPQASVQTAQNIAQGDNATPLETGLRQHGNVESQRAASNRATRDTSLAASNNERRQEQIKAAQELVDCLGAGMDLLSVEQVKQIKEAAAAAGNEPGEALRSFGERLRDLRKENPHASEADLKEAVKSAVQAMIDRARGPRRRADTRQATAESEVQRDVMRLPETRRANPPGRPRTPFRQNVAGGRVRGRADAQLHQSRWVQPARGDPEPRRGTHQELPPSSAFRHRARTRDDQQRGWRARLGSRGS